METKKSLTLSFCLLLGIASQAQNSPLEEIREQYQSMAYSKVIELCEKQLKSEEDHSKYARYLANSYRLVNNYEMSAYWLTQLIEADIAEQDDYLYLALAKKTLGEYEESQKWFTHYDALVPSNTVAKMHLNSRDYSLKLGKVNEGISIQNVMATNTASNDFGAVYHKGKLVFSSSRTEGASSKKTYKWDGQNYLDLYSLSKDGREIKNLSSAINTSFHEGPICFTSDGKTAYFTRNNYLKGKKGKMEDGTINLKIYSSSLVDGTWTDIKEFKHNSETHSTGHATISFDGKVMVYASDRQDGAGKTDLYMCTKGLYGWSMPVSLDNSINTTEQEVFPFLHKDGTLYFSSNGHLGLGGLDVFKCEGFLDGKRVIEHVDAPINSQMDDFCFYLEGEGSSGFISSNRKGGAGGDDIYSFTITEIENRLSLIGKVLEEDTKRPLNSSTVEIWSNGSLLETPLVDNSGGFVSRFKAEDCPILIKVSNGDDWSSYEAEVSHCNANQEEINLGDIFLAQVNNSWQAQVNSRYSDQAVNKNTSNVHPPQIQQHYSGQQQTQHSQQFVQPQIKDPVQVNGMITNYDNQPVGGLLITVTDKATGRTWQTESPYGGQLDLQLDRGNVYEITAQKEGFTKTTAEVNTNTSYNQLNIGQAINRSMMPLETGSTIILDNILYDLGKWTIRKDAALELDKLIKTLNDNPTMVIELSSHTDCRGSASDNLKLSEKRAMAAVRYIIDHGVSPYRITGKGYGETKLINECSDGYQCPEIRHQENRRTEIKILSY